MLGQSAYIRQNTLSGITVSNWFAGFFIQSILFFINYYTLSLRVIALFFYYSTCLLRWTGKKFLRGNQMTGQETNDLHKADNQDVQAADDSAAEESAPDEQSAAGKRKEAYKGYRETSYGVLFIGAVFVINAMETGSYRTPWPIAIVVSLIGLGLYGYSRLLQSKEKN